MKIKFLLVLNFLLFVNSRFEVNKLFYDNKQILHSMQAISDKEKPFMESIIGCSMKCAEMCNRFVDDSKLIQCASLCGCRDLIRKVETINNADRYDEKVVYEDIKFSDKALSNLRF